MNFKTIGMVTVFFVLMASLGIVIYTEENRFLYDTCFFCLKSGNCSKYFFEDSNASLSNAGCEKLIIAVVNRTEVT